MQPVEAAQGTLLISVVQRGNVLGVVEAWDSADERAVLDNVCLVRPPYELKLGSRAPAATMELRMRSRTTTRIADYLDFFVLECEDGGTSSDFWRS